MTKKEQFSVVIEVLGQKYPTPKTELHYQTPYQLLVATMLAAQCTDKRVNIVTAELFKRCPDAKSMSQLSFEELKEYIKSINFLNNKAKNILDASAALVEKYDGQVPDTLEDLTALPGVGRKTAHVVMSNAFGKAVLAVDTHVFRVANRIGLAKATNVLETEKQLVAHVPDELIGDFHHYLILHGRYVCKARSPKCEECGLTHVCDYYRLYS
jgi:endonuclease III